MLNYISQLPTERFAATWPRRVAVLGSTGSIGRSALAVMERLPDYFQVAALAGGNNAPLLAEQAMRWRPSCLAVRDEQTALALRDLLAPARDYHPEILRGAEGYDLAAALPEADLTLSAQAGAAGLRGTYAAARQGKVVALANKESLVLAGELIRTECLRSGASILPVDSEHNAVFQCLCGQLTTRLPGGLEATPLPGSSDPVPGVALRRIILTASGGPFLGLDPASLDKVTPKEALAHPTWNMGTKISIDSATMMNKGMEYVEACRLFGLRPDQVEVLIHPQSVIHSLVEFKDASRLAQLGAPDMRIPIAYCLGWPYRLESGGRELDLATGPDLTFSTPDPRLFPALDYWREAMTGGRGLTIALNAANEVAVSLFLEEKISFAAITRLARMVLDQWDEKAEPADLESVAALDARARTMSLACARKIG
ncbi:MAG: 1-deoxy-D-xylulose-5-phosphate reductoisomerase [Desulfovibrionaceae bacterium]|nr:1-deoxy-D-xylulose-5-phosphate reductoisomerase [Desulfovibrionaceae bacterium]